MYVQYMYVCMYLQGCTTPPRTTRLQLGVKNSHLYRMDANAPVPEDNPSPRGLG